ncbi:antitoxin VbhA family protein, partial [Serratia ureilytica]
HSSGRTCKVSQLYACLIRILLKGNLMTKQQRIDGFRKAEASLKLEGMDPAGTPFYESVKARIISGEITYEQGKAEILSHHKARAEV